MEEEQAEENRARIEARTKYVADCVAEARAWTPKMPVVTQIDYTQACNGGCLLVYQLPCNGHDNDVKMLKELLDHIMLPLLGDPIMVKYTLPRHMDNYKLLAVFMDSGEENAYMLMQHDRAENLSESRKKMQGYLRGILKCSDAFCRTLTFRYATQEDLYNFGFDIPHSSDISITAASSSNDVRICTNANALSFHLLHASQHHPQRTREVTLEVVLKKPTGQWFYEDVYLATLKRPCVREKIDTCKDVILQAQGMTINGDLPQINSDLFPKNTKNIMLKRCMKVCNDLCISLESIDSVCAELRNEKQASELDLQASKKRKADELVDRDGEELTFL